MSEFDRDLNPACCPEEDRKDGRKTVGGHPIVDLHRHKGLWKGTVLEGNASGIRPRMMFWGRNGRLSQEVESPYDIRKGEKRG